MKKNLINLALIAVFCSKFANAQQLVGGLPVNTVPVAQVSMLAVACDTIFSFPTIVTWPCGLASDGVNLWTSSNNVTYLSKYSSAGVLLDTLNVPNPIGGSYGGDLDYDGANLLFCREQDGMLYKINPVTKTIVAQFPLPQFGAIDPNDDGVAFDGTYIWHTTYAPSSILYKLDAANGAVLDSFIISSNYVLPIKFIGGHLYGLDLTAYTAIQIDTANGNIISTTPWCLNYPLGLAQHNGHVWGLASSATDRIYEFESLILNTHDIGKQEEFNFTINNPVEDKLIVQFQHTLLQSVALNITDMQGRIVLEKRISLTESRTEIDISRLSKGMYVLQMLSGNLRGIKKFIVN